MWVAILIVALVLAYAVFVIVYQLRALMNNKPGFDDCDCGHSKAKALVAEYKALKKKEEKAKSKSR